MNTFLPISKQIQVLFEQRRHPETGEPYTLQEVSNQMSISLATLSQLRNGKITNPQLSTLREICRFFDVPLRYFETTTVEECIAVLHGDDNDVDDDTIGIAFRLAHLSEESKEDILKIVQWIQAAELFREEHQDEDYLDAPHLEDYED